MIMSVVLQLKLGKKTPDALRTMLAAFEGPQVLDLHLLCIDEA